MNFLIFDLNYHPEPIGIGPYTAKLASFLASRGHDVTAIVGNPYYPDWRLARGHDPAGSITRENDVLVYRVPHYIPRRPTGPKRIAHYVSFARSAARAEKLVERADLVLAIAPSLIAAPVALRCANRLGAVSWLHIQDFEVEAALATGLLSGGPIARLAEGFERRTIAAFDQVSSISPTMVAKAAGISGSADQALELRNWADADLSASPDGVARMRAELSIGGGKVVLYSGNLALKQGSDIICEAAQLTRDRTDIRWLVCGEGSARDRFAQAALDLPNLHFRGLVPRERLGHLLALADVHVLTQVAGAADLVLPSKLTNMLASGRPVIATAGAGTSLADEVEGCGLVVPPGDAASLARAVTGLCDDDQRRLDLGRKAGMRAVQRWSAPVLLDQFALALEATVEGRQTQ